MKQVKKYKISRRLKAPLFEKCQSQKFILREQRRVTKQRRGGLSDFGRQLAEKQKVRYLYSISERVLKNYVKKAVASAGAIPAEEVLVENLERRLDNVIYQLGLAPTRRMARQMVSHGHFTINKRKTTIPSYRVRDNDIISIREGSTKTTLFRTMLAGSGIRPRANWVSWDGKIQEGKISGKPTNTDDIFSLPVILEYYSR